MIIIAVEGSPHGPARCASANGIFERDDEAEGLGVYQVCI
jgi:hypothetical protein